jgi:hypothetical protein
MPNIYTIWDNKGKFFSTPFYSRNDEVANRDFSNVVMNPDNPMSNSKGDYSLYRIGVFDGDSFDAPIFPTDKPILIAFNFLGF